jgi:hypothetical protein
MNIFVNARSSHRRQVLGLLLAATALLVASLMTRFSAAHATGYSGTMTSGYDGRCLDADLNTINANGTRVQLWDCNGQPQQKWSLNGKVEAAIKWYTDKIGNTRYDGHCELAVELAYGTSGRYATAMDNWRARLAAGQAHKASDSPYTAAPRVALVFWANTDRYGYGHVAISLGNGNIVTTSGPGGGIRIAPITYFWNQGPVGCAYEPW